MSPTTEWVVMVTSTLAATGTLGTMTFAAGIYRSVKRHERTLYGEEEVHEWDGLTTAVEALEERVGDLETRLRAEGET